MPTAVWKVVRLSGAFAAAVRERARLAWAALQAAHRDHDPDLAIVAEAEWEDVSRVARAHGVDLAHDASTGLDSGAGEDEPGEPEQGVRP